MDAHVHFQVENPVSKRNCHIKHLNPSQVPTPRLCPSNIMHVQPAKNM
uniref:Uncharacterized protein n=1 Tax=Arundo donax TaxID=35708 RepID=A0A0A9AR22_ARUDO